MQRKLRIGAAWALVLIYMAVILLLSSDTATESDAKSGTIVELIKPVLDAIGMLFSNSPMDAGVLDAIVRKSAHMFNYFVLSLLCCHAFYISIRKSHSKRVFLFAWGWATVFSAVDEFYQTFIPGRSGQVTDVCVDNAGILIGILVALLILHLCKKRQQGKDETAKKFL